MALRSLNVTLDGKERDRYFACLRQLSSVMDVVQSEEYNLNGGEQMQQLKAKLMKMIEKVHDDFGLRLFAETLFRMMIAPFQTKDNIYVKKCVQFFFDVVTDERWVPTEENSPPGEATMLNDTVSSMNTTCSTLFPDDDTETLPLRMLRLCEKYHWEGRRTIRLRLMQTISKIIPDRMPVKKIRRHFQGKLIKMLLTRIKDKIDEIRSIAASLLCKFYGFGMPFHTAVLDALLRHLATDPSPAVRAALLTNMPISDETLEHIAERTGDSSPPVREAALRRLEKDVRLRELTFEMREAILKSNTTTDEASADKKVRAAMNALMQKWLTLMKGDPCEFLRIVNVRLRPRLGWIVLDTLYTQPDQEAYEQMSQPIMRGKKYPDDSLCIESTFVWLYMFKRFKNDEYVFQRLNMSTDEMLDYIKEYVEVVEAEGDLSKDDLNYRGWMLGDMLQILTFLIEEECGRKAILEYLPTLFHKKDLMDERNTLFCVRLISLCSDLNDDSNTHLIDIVNSMIDSDRSSTSVSNGNSNGSQEPQMPSTSSADIDDMKTQLGQLLHNQMKKQQDQEISARNGDMHRAQSLQDEIEILGTKIETLKQKIIENAANEANSQEDEEVWSYSDKTLLIAITAVKAAFELSGKVTNFVRTFYELYVVKAVARSRSPAVRRIALEFVCLMALNLKDEISRAAMFCLSGLLRDVLQVKEVALKALYDLVLVHSFVEVANAPGVDQIMTGSANGASLEIKHDADGAASGMLKSLLLSYIRHDNQTIVKVSVAGVLKLLFKHEMNNSRLITMFLLNWAIPSYECQLRFKDVALVIPIYATAGEKEATEVAECLILSIKKAVVRINQSVGLADVPPNPDIAQIANMIIKCTEPSKLQHFQRPYIAHFKIAFEALTCLRTDLTTDERLHYAQLLKVLNLSQCPISSLNDLTLLADEVKDNVGPYRKVSEIINGFMQYLATLKERLDSGENADEEGIRRGAFDSEDDDDEENNTTIQSTRMEVDD